MKKIYAFILLLFSIFGLTACEDKPSIPVVNQFIVIFDSVGGSSVQKQIVDKGNTITKPTDPTRMDTPLRDGIGIMNYSCSQRLLIVI